MEVSDDPFAALAFVKVFGHFGNLSPGDTCQRRDELNHYHAVLSAEGNIYRTQECL
jgi:hypothetical protein